MSLVASSVVASVAATHQREALPAPESTVIQGKWGYYAITYEQFVRLKELCKRIRKHLATAAAEHRWSRKKPENRKLRRVLRNAAGQPIGREWPGIPLHRPEVAHPNLAGWQFNAANLQYVLWLYTRLRRPGEHPKDVPSVPPGLLTQLDLLLEETGGFNAPQGGLV